MQVTHFSLSSASLKDAEDTIYINVDFDGNRKKPAKIVALSGSPSPLDLTVFSLKKAILESFGLKGTVYAVTLSYFRTQVTSTIGELRAKKKDDSIGTAANEIMLSAAIHKRFA